MVLDERTIDGLAEELLEAENKRKPIDPITDRYPSISIEESYKIQLRVVHLKSQDGQVVVGKKIGLTSKGMQQLLGVNEPDYGHILDKMVLYDGENISLSQLIQPKVEAEIAFILKKDLRGPGVTVASVLDATEGVMPAIEVIDSRIKNWRIKIQDTIADNASSARVVLGERMLPPQKINLKYVGMVFEKNGEIAATAAGAAVLGNPAQSVAWLANKLSEFGITLKSGEIILSGSLIAAVEVTPKDVIKATFDRLGSVTVKFIS
ncbi:MAG: 2-keto-4-pentenoate hydratase [Candidatus Bathyarchaeia archaeon]